MLPVVLDVRGKAVLVVGGGPVGRRKAAAVFAAGGIVTVVDPQPPPAGFTGVWLPEAYRAAHLDGAWLLFACGPPAVNARVLADAAERRVWALDAGDPGRSDFTLPAVAHRGPITLAVGTGTPGLSARLRDELAGHLSPADVAWAGLLAELRPRVKGLPPDRRRAALAALTAPGWRDRMGDVPAARAAMLAILEAEGERGA